MPEVAVKEAPIEAPEDVAALYAWADLKGLKYHDFSAARRAFRAHLRERAEQAQRETEMRAKARAEATRVAGSGAGHLLRAAGESSTTVQAAEQTAASRTAARGSMLPQRFPRRRQARDLTPTLPKAAEAKQRTEPLEQRPVGVQGQVLAAEELLLRSGSAAATLGPSGLVLPEPREVPPGQLPMEAGERSEREAAGDAIPPAPKARTETAPSGPAWIYGEGTPSTAGGTSDLAISGEKHASGSSVLDTLQHSRERVASRWYALRGVFDPAAPAMEPTQAHTREGGTPVLAVFSLAGGVGKTSLTAALGRSLSAMGERVLLADITSHGLLPFYFGSKELRTGLVRKFLPPSGSSDAPISLVSYEPSGQQEEGRPTEDAAQGIARRREDFDRIVVDLSPGASWMAQGLLRMDTTVLVPVAPDMNAVIGLSAVERFFAGLAEAGGRPVQPRYLLTQFDSSLPLHLDVREVMQQQLGDRLLPFVIRRSPAVSEALAEGMTVIDYAPEAGVAEDYRDLANWVRRFAAPARGARKNARWSER